MQPAQYPVWQAASPWRRWLAFNLVGILGIAVQICALTAMTVGLHWNYLLSTLLAVEIAILHNFLWHERWTWVDTASRILAGRFGRLKRFHVANGTISLLGNLLLMWLFVARFGIHPVAANLIAISLCALANFFASDRWVFRERSTDMKARMSIWEPSICAPSKPRDGSLGRVTYGAPGQKKRRHGMPTLPAPVLLAVLGFGMMQGNPAEAAVLRPETVSAWARYAAATERRIEQELGSTRDFLALEYHQDQAEAERKAVLAGEIPVTKMKTRDANGRGVDVPAGMIHHWRGSVFIPGVDIDFILARIANPGAQDTRQEDVLVSRVLDRSPDSLKLYLKLRRVKFVTVIYNTEHEIHYSRPSNTRAYSRSIATRIAEVEKLDSGEEREKPIGQDRGFLWRLNSYWRYEQVKGGVIVECESISLSRTVPGPLEFFIRPLIDSAARESMTRTLDSMRDRMVRALPR